jgi:hypothetical protein
VAKIESVEDAFHAWIDRQAGEVVDSHPPYPVDDFCRHSGAVVLALVPFVDGDLVEDCHRAFGA